jgi:hypothetical protein
MARRILSVVARTLRNDTAPDHGVHFHNDGTTGHPAPCFDHGCSRPRLDPNAR